MIVNKQMVTRESICLLTKGAMVELGVASGKFSEQMLLANSEIEVLYSIDKWNDHHNSEEEKKARKRLEKFGDRSIVITGLFSETARRFPHNTFDLIYIDGYAHTGQDNGRTLRQWWHRLKRGGVFAGHDYCSRYVNNMKQIEAFLISKGHTEINITIEPDFPSWWVIK